MPPISQPKKDKISEQILHHLFSASPQPKFTAQIAREIARDEEFTKTLLTELRTKGLVVEVAKNVLGGDYIRRRRWRLSNTAFEAYSKHQP
ncbi:MAG: hypothetical protein ABIH92_04405 [Nanoarchaeota archaeon]